MRCMPLCRSHAGQASEKGGIDLLTMQRNNADGYPTRQRVGPDKREFGDPVFTRNHTV
jgi:hypothetical protein